LETLLPDDARAVAETPTTGVEVILADGRCQDLSLLTPQELLVLQWDEERAFARQILAAPKGSAARAAAMRRAYETIARILMAQHNASGRGMTLGFHPRHQRLVVELLARQQKRGLQPRFFEIGYGTGVLLKGVSDAGFPVAGIEVSATMQAQACQLLGPGHEDQLHVGEFLAYDLPAGQQRCSLIYWNDVFEHIPPDEIRDYLRRIHVLLVPGGQLVTITPNWHLRPWDITRAFCPPRTESAGLHLKEYTLREVSRLLDECGFRRVTAPLVVVPHRIVLCGSGLAGLKRRCEPALEWLPWKLTRLLCRGFGLSLTIATKAE
jgi:SAM-dependent methyltransferase